MPAPALEAFGALGMLRFADDQNRYLWCTVVLYPLGDLFLISDRVMLPDGTPVNDQEFVYFALTPNTQRFLRQLPQLPCGSFLDVGSGCGARLSLNLRTLAFQSRATCRPSRLFMPSSTGG